MKTTYYTNISIESTVCICVVSHWFRSKLCGDTSGSEYIFF